MLAKSTKMLGHAKIRMDWLASPLPHVLANEPVFFSSKGLMLEKFSEMIRGNLSKMERLKLVALVTIEVLQLHNTSIPTSSLIYAGPCSRYH